MFFSPPPLILFGESCEHPATFLCCLHYQYHYACIEQIILPMSTNKLTLNLDLENENPTDECNYQITTNHALTPPLCVIHAKNKGVLCAMTDWGNQQSLPITFCPLRHGSVPGRLSQGQDYGEEISSEIDPDRVWEMGSISRTTSAQFPDARRVNQAQTGRSTRLWVSITVCDVFQWHNGPNGGNSHRLLPKCFQMIQMFILYILPCGMECKTQRYREDTVKPHYLLMMDNLWHHGYTGEPLRNTLIRDMHKTHAQFAFAFVWLLVALFVTSRFFSSAFFVLSHSHSGSV